MRNTLIAIIAFLILSFVNILFLIPLLILSVILVVLLFKRLGRSMLTTVKLRYYRGDLYSNSIDINASISKDSVHLGIMSLPFNSLISYYIEEIYYVDRTIRRLVINYLDNNETKFAMLSGENIHTFYSHLQKYLPDKELSNGSL